MQGRENIIKTYKLIHKYFFKYAIFGITILIGTLIFQSFLKRNALNLQTNGDNHSLIIKEKELIGAFEKQLKQNIESDGVQVKIIQGYMSNSGDYIESSNNLATYKGYIIPRFFYIYKTFPLQNISYFSEKNYESKALDTFVQNVLFAKKERNEKQEINIQLPSKGTIIETFDLECMFKSKIYQTICNQHIENFLNSFFVYTINSDYLGFKKVVDAIINNEKYKDLLCQSMDKYIIYSNDTSTTIEETISKCSNESLTTFKKLAAFVEIQEQLESRQISKSIYNDKEINAYKLVSTQQTVYKDVINNRINTTNILQYLNFMKELLVVDKIDPFYKDLSYRFNNKYILPWIENPDNPISKNRKSDADEIIKQITVVNNGDELIGFKGLTYQIGNQSLLPVQIENKIQEINAEEKITTLLNNISYFKTKEKIFSGEDIFINGDLIIDNPQKDEAKVKLNTALLLQFKQNEFIVKKIKIENQNTLNAVIKEILSKNEYSIGRIKEYINQNFAFYDNASQIDTSNIFCDQIKNKIMNDAEIQLNTCSKEKISLIRTINGIAVTYTINLAEYTITSILISDHKMQTAINEKLTNISTNEINLGEVIRSIIYYNDIQTTTTSGADNMIIITEKIKNYLGINIDDIAEKSGKILIAFNVGGIKFIGNYNIAKHIIYPIYFKEVLLNNIPAKIMNFSLSLDDTNKTDIYKFISNPSDYIKTVSPESYLLYDAFNHQTNQ